MRNLLIILLIYSFKKFLERNNKKPNKKNMNHEAFNENKAERSISSKKNPGFFNTLFESLSPIDKEKFKEFKDLINSDERITKGQKQYFTKKDIDDLLEEKRIKEQKNTSKGNNISSNSSSEEKQIEKDPNPYFTKEEKNKNFSDNPNNLNKLNEDNTFDEKYFDYDDLVKGIIMKEILDKPVSLR